MTTFGRGLKKRRAICIIGFDAGGRGPMGVRLESMRDNRFNEVLSLTSGKVCA